MEATGATQRDTVIENRQAGKKESQTHLQLFSPFQMRKRDQLQPETAKIVFDPEGIKWEGFNLAPVMALKNFKCISEDNNCICNPCIK